MSDLTELYQQVILDHNRRPRNRGRLPVANRVAHGDNPTCGDQCSVFLRLDGDRIAEITFDGQGCAISQASASLMTTLLKGGTAPEAKELYDQFHRIVTTGKRRTRSAISPPLLACTPSRRASSARRSAGTPRWRRSARPRSRQRRAPAAGPEAPEARRGVSAARPGPPPHRRRPSPEQRRSARSATAGGRRARRPVP